MPSKTVTVGSSVGLHARPAARIAFAAGRYSEEITLSLGDSVVNANSSLLIMTLGAEKGATVTVTSDNAQAVEEIAQLIEENFS